MPVAKPESSDARVIAHVDMDCFYVQVEQRKQPTLRGHPSAVVQYNSWKGGGLIAVGYEARKFGVKRSMRGDDAKKICPEIQLVQVPVARGKANLSLYRDAGSEVISILSKKGRCERASIDEVYLDLTEAAETMLAEHPHGILELLNEEALKSHVLGLHLDGLNARDCVREWFLMKNVDHRDKLLACGALIVSELRLEVLKETEFTCSAGIAHNKMLAKLTSGLNKPAQQTAVPFSSVKMFLEPLPIKKMKQLGGKLGTSLETELGVNTVGGLLQFSEANLQELYGRNTGTWLWNIARGICGEEVVGRLLPKSHGSGKTFPGPQALKSLSSVQKWLNDLCEELSERIRSDLEQNKRIAHTLTLHVSAYKLNDSESLKKFPSKSCPLRYGTAKIQEDSLGLFQVGLREYVGVYNVKMMKSNQNEWAITGLSVSASKIVAIPSGTSSIMNYFHNEDRNCASRKESDAVCTENAASLLSSSGLGRGSFEQSYLAGPEIDTYEDDEAKTQQDMPVLYLKEDETEVFKDSVFGTKFEDSQPLSFYQMKEQKEMPKEEILMSSTLGDQNRVGSKLTQSETEFVGKEVGLDMKSGKQKRKFDTEKKTTPSILKFFQSYESCSFSDQAHMKNFQEPGASSSSGTLATSNGCECNVGEDVSRRSYSWNYKSNEIDPIVLNELPPEIQAEVRASLLQPQDQAKTVKRGSSIVHYFLPTKNS